MPIRTSFLLVVAGAVVQTGCATPRGRFDAADVGTGPDSAASIATPDAEPTRTALAGAVDTVVASVTTSSTAVGPRESRRLASHAAMGSDEAAVKPELPSDEGGGADQELAKKLSNPISSLISVPLQSNWDSGMGPDGHGRRYVLNVQPVIPISLNENWNLISRTIVPIIQQEGVVPGSGSQSGVGDVTQSCFFSPKEPTESGWIWGAGPVFLLPTAPNDLLGGEKWGAGPTLVALKQESGWTYGVLANHIWSFAGNGRRSEVNSSFVQPFLSYTTPDAWTFGLNTEATYNWLEDDLGVPINVAVSKLVRIGGMPMQLSVGTRYWVERTQFGPKGFGFRFTLTFLFPAGK